MSFPGMGAGMSAGGAASLSPEQLREKQMIGYMQAAMEACAGKAVLSGVMGFGLGGMFGLFMSSMRYDTSMSTGSAEVSKLPLREQLKTGFKDMGKTSWSSAKNFGKIGLLFSGLECGIEGYRGKNAISNNIAAGCAAGGILAISAGPQAMLGGCAAFGAFSAAIEAYMHMDSAEPGREPIT